MQPAKTPPTPEVAFENLRQVARAFNGNADQHEVLTQSLQVVAARMNRASQLEQEAATAAEAAKRAAAAPPAPEGAGLPAGAPAVQPVPGLPVFTPVNGQILTPSQEGQIQPQTPPPQAQ